MSSWYEYFTSFIPYYGSFGRTSPTNNIPKLKTLIKEKTIMVISEQEIQNTLKSLKKVNSDENPRLINDKRPAFIRELEERFISKISTIITPISTTPIISIIPIIPNLSDDDGMNQKVSIEE